MDIIRTFAIAFRTQGANSTINTLKRFSAEADKADQKTKQQHSLAIKERQFDIKETTRLINTQKNYIKDIEKGKIIFDSFGKKDAALTSANARLKSLMGIREDQRELLSEEQQAFFDMQKGAKSGASGLLTLGKGLALITTATYAFKKALNWTKYGEDVLFAAHAAGVAAGEFQKVSGTATVFGGTRQGTASALANINSQLTDLRFGRAQSNNLTEGARLYGIAYGSGNSLLNATEIYQNALKALEGRSAAEALDIQKLYGIQQGEFAFIRRNGYAAYLAQMQKMQAEGFAGIDAKSLSDMSDLQIQWRNAMAGFSDTFHETLGNLVPVLKATTYILDGFNKLYRLFFNIEDIRGKDALGFADILNPIGFGQKILNEIGLNPFNLLKSGQIADAYGNTSTTNEGNTYIGLSVNDPSKTKEALENAGANSADASTAGRLVMAN
jgi:hypothetical protein